MAIKYGKIWTVHMETYREIGHMEYRENVEIC